MRAASLFSHIAVRTQDLVCVVDGFLSQPTIKPLRTVVPTAAVHMVDNEEGDLGLATAPTNTAVLRDDVFMQATVVRPTVAKPLRDVVGVGLHSLGIALPNPLLRLGLKAGLASAISVTESAIAAPVGPPIRVLTRLDMTRRASSHSPRRYQVHVKWDCGSTLGLVAEDGDRYQIIT